MAHTPAGNGPQSGKTGRELGEEESSENATNAAKKLGKLGGQARRKKLTAQERTESARKAAAARWGKKKE